jgi:two-component system cell cycle sensor histidine kinase/response regulator CckA
VNEAKETFLQVSLNPAGQAETPHVIAVLNDVTEFKNLQMQFVQSQKMQAISQLVNWRVAWPMISITC